MLKNVNKVLFTVFVSIAVVSIFLMSGVGAKDDIIYGEPDWDKVPDAVSSELVSKICVPGCSPQVSSVAKDVFADNLKKHIEKGAGRLGWGQKMSHQLSAALYLSEEVARTQTVLTDSLVMDEPAQWVPLSSLMIRRAVREGVNSTRTEATGEQRTMHFIKKWGLLLTAAVAGLICVFGSACWHTSSRRGSTATSDGVFTADDI